MYKRYSTLVLGWECVWNDVGRWNKSAAWLVGINVVSWNLSGCRKIKINLFILNCSVTGCIPVVFPWGFSKPFQSGSPLALSFPIAHTPCSSRWTKLPLRQISLASGAAGRIVSGSLTDESMRTDICKKNSHCFYMHFIKYKKTCSHCNCKL